MMDTESQQDHFRKILLRVFRRLLVVMAAAYLSLVVIGELRPDLLNRRVPGPILFFSQIAGLFTEAKTADVEFRVEARACGEENYREIDTDPLFPMQAGNKENRFQRAVYFYSGNHKVMARLEKFIIRSFNERMISAGDGRGTGLADRIVGIRIVSASTPIPLPGDPVLRYQRLPLAEYPPERVRVLYSSPEKIIARRCGDAP